MTAPGPMLETEVLNTTSVNSISIAGQIGSIVSQIDGQLHAALLSGQWKGLSAAAGQVAWVALSTQLTSLQTALNNIGTGLGQVTTNYATTDLDGEAPLKNVASEASGIGAALGVSIGGSDGRA